MSARLESNTLMQHSHNSPRSTVTRGSSVLVSGCVKASAILLAGLAFAAAQEPSVILKSLDNLEKRLIKVEGDLGKVRKLGAPAASPARPDSNAAGLSSRLDSLALRVHALEHAAKPAPAAPVTASIPSAASAASAAAEPAASPAVESEIASLVREVKSLTESLRQGKPVAVSPAPAQAKSSVTHAAPAAESPKTSTAKAAASSEAPATLDLKGDIQIQGERKFTSKSKRDNLDDFWGRLNFGAEYNAKEFQSKINIRIFPEGFGFEPLTGASFDTVGQGSLKVQTAQSSRIVINHAWAKYTLGMAKLKVGRFETVETRSENFGNYVDLGTSGKYMSRPAVHNALEASAPLGPVAASALLGTGDRKLNRGFLRLYGKYAPVPVLQMALGYRANLFDRFRFPDEEILQRYDANFFCKLPLGWAAFAEGAVLQAAGRKDDTPLLLGVQPPMGKALDLLSLEAEWLPDRKTAKKDNAWLFNAHARKVVGRVKIDAGLYSDTVDPAWNSAIFGLRMTSNIK